MGDGAAEAKRAHACCKTAYAGGCLLGQYETARCRSHPHTNQGIEHTELRVAARNGVLQQPLHGEQAHLTRARLAMADACLCGSDAKRRAGTVATTMHCSDRPRLRGVTQCSARAVQLSTAHLCSSVRGTLQSRQDQRALRRAVRRRQAR